MTIFVECYIILQISFDFKHLSKYTVINVVCCVGRVEIQIEMVGVLPNTDRKGRCTANTDSIV